MCVPGSWVARQAPTHGTARCTDSTASARKSSRSRPARATTSTSRRTRSAVRAGVGTRPVCERPGGGAIPRFWVEQTTRPLGREVPAGAGWCRSAQAVDPEDVDTSTPAVGPLDDAGRLLHEDDPAAQLALAVCRLEQQLSPRGLADLPGLRVLTTDRTVLADVYDVLTERLDATGARPLVEVEERPGLGVPGMLLALQPLLPPTDEGTTMTTTPTSPAETLRGLPDVHLPGDPAYDELRTPWNLAVDQRPAAVAVPRTAGQVADLVRAAVAAGLRVAPQSTGHGAGPFSGRAMDDTVLLRLSELTGVTVDPDVTHRPRARRHPVARGRRGGRTARPDRAARQRTRRGGGRLPARRRALLLRPQARPRVRLAAGRRAGHRRRLPGARGRRPGRRRLLGRPRRRRQLRGGHRARDRPAPDHRRRRRHAALGPRSGPRGGARLGGLDPRRPRLRDHVATRDELPRRCPSSHRSSAGDTW